MTVYQEHANVLFYSIKKIRSINLDSKDDVAALKI